MRAGCRVLLLKRLLEWLSLSHWDDDLGIRPAECWVLRGHMPETQVVRAQTLEMLVQRRQDFVFKPSPWIRRRGLTRARGGGTGTSTASR
jgi:hypothetical protein